MSKKGRSPRGSGCVYYDTPNTDAPPRFIIYSLIRIEIHPIFEKQIFLMFIDVGKYSQFWNDK